LPIPFSLLQDKFGAIAIAGNPHSGPAASVKLTFFIGFFGAYHIMACGYLAGRANLKPLRDDLPTANAAIFFHVSSLWPGPCSLMFLPLAGCIGHPIDFPF
jgi:hypothetical protein